MTYISEDYATVNYAQAKGGKKNPEQYSMSFALQMYKLMIIFQVEIFSFLTAHTNYNDLNKEDDMRWETALIVTWDIHDMFAVHEYVSMFKVIGMFKVGGIKQNS